MKTFYLALSFIICLTVNLSAAEKIIIDSDIGEDIDDLSHQRIRAGKPRVRGAGNYHGGMATWPPVRVWRAGLCQVMGKTDVQVAQGYVRSMPRPDTLYLGNSGGVRYGEIAPEEMEKDLPPESPLKADSLIAALAHKYPGEVTVITMRLDGQYRAVSHPAIRRPPAKLKRIVTNGGNFTGENEKIGWNLRYDPGRRPDCSSLRCPLGAALRGYLPRMHHRARRVWTVCARADTELTRFLLDGVHWWQTNKTDATTWPHVSDLNTFAYILGGYVDTRPGQVVISVGPVGSLAGLPGNR